MVVVLKGMGWGTKYDKKFLNLFKITAHNKERCDGVRGAEEHWNGEGEGVNSSVLVVVFLGRI